MASLQRLGQMRRSRIARRRATAANTSSPSGRLASLSMSSRTGGQATLSSTPGCSSTASMVRRRPRSGGSRAALVGARRRSHGASEALEPPDTHPPHATPPMRRSWPAPMPSLRPSRVKPDSPPALACKVVDLTDQPEAPDCVRCQRHRPVPESRTDTGPVLALCVPAGRIFPRCDFQLTPLPRHAW